MGASPLSGHLRTPGDLLRFAAFPPEWASPGGRRVFVPTRGNSMAKSLKLVEILGAETSDGSERAERLQEVVMGETPRGHVGGTRSVRPVKRAKRGCVERVSG